MKGLEIIKELRKEIKADGMENENIDILTIMDYLSVIGVENASDVYFKILGKTHNV